MLNRFKNALYGAGTTDDSSIRSHAEYQRSVGESLIHRTLTRSSSFREDLLAGVGRSRGDPGTNSNNNHNRSRQNNGLGPFTTTKQVLNIPPISSREGHNSNNNSVDSLTRYTEAKSNNKPAKFPYSRPEFLQLRTDDEISVSADHQIRPIILPRDLSRLPWKAGYAECINAGKSARNEDQAVIYRDEIIKPSSSSTPDKEDPDSIPIYHKIPWTYFGMFDGHAGTAVAVAAASQLHTIIRDKLNQIADMLICLEFSSWLIEMTCYTSSDDEIHKKSKAEISLKHSSTSADDQDSDQKESEIPETIGCERTVVSNLQEKPNELIETASGMNDEDTKELTQASEHMSDIVSDSEHEPNTTNASTSSPPSSPGSLRNSPNKRTALDTLTESQENIDQTNFLMELSRNKSYDEKITTESLIRGVLESAFLEMDSLIAQDKQDYKMPGGCTAIVSLFILGKLYVCNAGDSRAIVYKGRKVVPMSYDFTPVSERERILRLGMQRQDLLGSDFTHLEFINRPTRKDLGKQVLYKDAYMTGWSVKTVTYDDLKFPLVWGEGKRSRVLATIGVTRGFGDHELRSQYGSVPIKPFLTPEPEVKVLRLDDDESLEAGDVLIMGTDGLWDVTSNEEAAEIVESSFDLFPDSEESRSKYRYITAAQDLVIHSRGNTNNWNNVWRTGTTNQLASFDDISVFVIPLQHYRDEYNEWLGQRKRTVQSIRRAIRPNTPPLMARPLE